MRRMQNYLKIIISIVTICLAAELGAQTLGDAQSLFNEGVAAIGDDNKELAVQKFEECVGICEELYEEEEDMDAEELLNNIQPTLPKLFYQVGTEKAKKRDLKGALEYLIKAKTTAGDMGYDDYVKKASNVMAKIHFSYGQSKFKAKNYDEALIDSDNAILEDPTYLNGHRLKIKILKAQGNDSTLIEATKNVQALDVKISDRNSIVGITVTYFYNKGVTAKQSSNYDEALESIQICLDLKNDNTDAHFLLTSIYNSKEDWANAILAANEGLKYESIVNQPRFNYELGQAYFGQGNNDAACEAYSKAAVGDYLENANYKMKHVVKCK